MKTKQQFLLPQRGGKLTYAVAPATLSPRSYSSRSFDCLCARRRGGLYAFHTGRQSVAWPWRGEAGGGGVCGVRTSPGTHCCALGCSSSGSGSSSNSNNSTTITTMTTTTTTTTTTTMTTTTTTATTTTTTTTTTCEPPRQLDRPKPKTLMSPPRATPLQ